MKNVETGLASNGNMVSFGRVNSLVSEFRNPDMEFTCKLWLAKSTAHDQGKGHVLLFYQDNPK